MIRIGEFSKLSRVSVRMLRHYDEIGLLKPAYIDSFTDYRYYREDQLPTIWRITALKDMGFALADIARILAVYDDREALERFFAERERELELLADDTRRKLTLLGTARKRLRKEETMNYNVTVRTIPERNAATLHTTIPCYSAEGTVWDVLRSETKGLSLVPADPCLLGITYLDGEYKEENVELEAWMTVKGSYPDTEHVKFRTLPAVTVASCTYKGCYDMIGQVYAAIIEWANGNGYSFTGPMFNIYHVSPRDTADPNEYVTEVCYPVQKTV